MTRDEKWIQTCREYMDFMCRNKRRPSKYYQEESKLVNWMKHNRKTRNKGKFPPNREKLFCQLLEVARKYQRTNQHAYIYMNGVPPLGVRPMLFVEEEEDREQSMSV